jgi:hypothetical protein
MAEDAFIVAIVTQLRAGLASGCDHVRCVIVRTQQIQSPTSIDARCLRKSLALEDVVLSG